MNIDYQALLDAVRAQKGVTRPDGYVRQRLGMKHPSEWTLVKQGKRKLQDRYQKSMDEMLTELGLNGHAAAPDGLEDSIAMTPLSPTPETEVEPEPEVLATEPEVEPQREVLATEPEAGPEIRIAPAAPTDGDDEVDVDALIEHARGWVGQHDVEPPANAVIAEIRYLGRQQAPALVREAFLDSFASRWWSDLRAKDRDRKMSALATTWREEHAIGMQDGLAEERARELAEQPPPKTVEEVRAERRGELWPAVRPLAEAPDLLERAVAFVHRSGVVHEEDTIKLVYLSCTSRVTSRPVNPLIAGASGGGKSHVSQRVLDTMPPEDVHMLTTASALSLVYDDPADEDSLKHSIIALFEATPLQGDDHSTFALCVRTLMSEGRIIHKTVSVTPEGGKFSETIIKNGPVAMIITTTAHDIHAENETRMTRIAIHEDPEQTRAVLRLLGKAATGVSADVDQAELEQWRNLQRWIAAGPKDVIIPYANQLVEAIPPLAVRFRRDASAVLSLVKAHALLYQAQRHRCPDGRVVATVDDYRAVHSIGARIMEESAGKRPPERVVTVVQHVQSKLAETATAHQDQPKPRRRPVGSRRTVPHREGDVYVASYRSLGEELGLDRKAAEHAIRRALDDGYIVNHETRPRQPMRLTTGTRTLADIVTLMLPDPDTLQ
jgi:hypothetical protein